MKKILLSLALTLGLVSGIIGFGLPASASSSLASCYASKGLKLPSVRERALEAAANGIFFYKGTVAQNQALQKALCSHQVGFGVVTGYQKTLRLPMSSTQNYTPVSSLTLKDGTTFSTSTLSGKIFLDVDPGGAKEEIELCTDIDLTNTNFINCTRGLAFSGTSTAAVAGLAQTHNAGTPVVMSNVQYVYQQFLDLNNVSQTATGLYTFSQLPLIPTSTPTDQRQAVSLYQLQQATSTGGTNGSAAVKGVWQGATLSDINSGTVTGTTGALLIPTNSDLAGTGGVAYVIPHATVTGTIDKTFGGTANSLATLNTSTLVVQNPNSATSTASANAIAISSVSSTLDTWVSSNAQVFTAGAYLNASSTPLALYLSESDGRVYPTNATTASDTIFGFIGFEKLGQSIATSSQVTVLVQGQVSGFTSLTTGGHYYGTNTAGAVSTTAGTIPYQLARAVNTTTLIIAPGMKSANGTVALDTLGVASVTETIGFKPNHISFYAVAAQINGLTSIGMSMGTWDANGGSTVVFASNDSTASQGKGTNAWNVQLTSGIGAGTSFTGTVGTVSSTGFILTQSSIITGKAGNLHWAAQE